MPTQEEFNRWMIEDMCLHYHYVTLLSDRIVFIDYDNKTIFVIYKNMNIFYIGDKLGDRIKNKFCNIQRNKIIELMANFVIPFFKLHRDVNITHFVNI